MWRADNDLAMLTEGPGWRVALVPYLENRDEVFRCPAVAAGGASAGGGADGGAGSEGGGGGIALSDITFQMFCRTGWKKERYDFKAGQYIATVVVNPEYKGVKCEDRGGGKYYIGIEDRWFFTPQSWSGNWDDIRFYVWIAQGSPYKLEVIGGDEGTGGSYKEFIFDLYVGEKLVLKDWTQHYGTVVDLTPFSKPGDYGMSKGAYEKRPSLDPRQFLVLDYPSAVADYDGAGSEDPWDKYFILDEEAWMAKYADDLMAGETYEAYQSLRHFGQVNMLFCDGHVEALSAEDLYETNPLWRGSR